MAAIPSPFPVLRPMVTCQPSQTFEHDSDRLFSYDYMTRVGITPPEVIIAADNKRLKAAKVALDLQRSLGRR